MKKRLNSFFFTCFCCIFLLLLLFQSKECIQLASTGLLIWYRNMIPSLFPFMVLSGFMIRCGLSVTIGQWLQPVLGIIFRLPAQMLYAIFMGFLCGFPMGAKIAVDMMETGEINETEGEYLLSFCNNIGPLYMLGYIIPLFGYQNTWKVLSLMYVIPFLYGVYLRYFSKIYSSAFSKTNYDKSMLNKKYFCSKTPTKHMSACSYSTHNTSAAPSYLSCFQQSLLSAIEQITMLGGCMVFFNCLLIFSKMSGTILSQTPSASLSPLITAVFSSLIEIGGGLQQLASIDSLTSASSAVYCLPLSLLTFGGFSCIAQTCFILKNTGLKISTYLKHKFIQSCIFILLMFL